MELTAEQIQFLTYTVLGEARGEGPEGMLGVANVIANRVDSPLYPDNPVDVVTQRRQFTATEDGQLQAAQREAPVGSALYNTAERIVRGAIVDRTLPDITGRAINYHTRAISPYWAAGAATRWGTVDIGAHRYYARQPVPPLNIPDVLSLIDTGGVRRAPSPLPRPVDRSFGNRGDVRLAEAVNRVNTQRRNEIAARILSTAGDRGEAAMSMTSRLGSRPDFSDSVAAPKIGDWDRARREVFTLNGLLDQRISMTAPNPPAAAKPVTVAGGAGGKVGARGDLAVTVSVKPGAATLKAGDTRTADSGLITYVRKTYPVDGYGRPIVDAPIVVKPAAKPSPTWRVQDAITKAQAGVRASSMAPTAAAAAAWKATSDPAPKAVTVSGGASGATSAMKSAAAVLNASQIKVSGTAKGGSAPMRAAAAAVSTRDLKLQPAGSTTSKSGARLAAGASAMTVDPKAKESAFKYVPVSTSPAARMIEDYTKTPLPVKAASPIVAPVPLPRNRRFGEGTIPANVKGDPVDFKKLADGIAAEGRRLSGTDPAPRIVAPSVPARRPDTVSPTPGKVKLSGVPDQPVAPAPRPRPVSTATIKPVGPSSIPARRPDSRPVTAATASRKPVVIEVVGGRRTASPRLVQPVGQYYSNGVANPAYRDYSPTYTSEGGGIMPSGAYSGGFVDSLGGTYYERNLR